MILFLMFLMGLDGEFPTCFLNVGRGDSFDWRVSSCFMTTLPKGEQTSPQYLEMFFKSCQKSTKNCTVLFEFRLQKTVSAFIKTPSRFKSLDISTNS